MRVKAEAHYSLLPLDVKLGLLFVAGEKKLKRGRLYASARECAKRAPDERARFELLCVCVRGFLSFMRL